MYSEVDIPPFSHPSRKGAEHAAAIPALSQRHQPQKVLILHDGNINTHWRIAFPCVASTSTKLELVDGGPAENGDDGAHLKAVAPLLCADQFRLIRKAFENAGYEPDKLVARSLVATLINGSPSAWVYKLTGHFHSGTPRSVVLTISNVGNAERNAAYVAQQWRGLNFLRNHLPLSTLEGGENIERVTTLRQYADHDRIVKPLALAVSSGQSSAAVAITEWKEGFVELNRFAGPYRCNIAEELTIPGQHTVYIGRAIAKLLTQIYASTYDPKTNLGVIPLGLTLNAGDIIIKLGNFNEPEIALCAANECKNCPPEALVDLITGGRDISTLNGEVQGRILDPNPANLSAIFSALAEGLYPRFNKYALALAEGFLISYAATQADVVREACCALHRDRALENFLQNSYGARNAGFRRALFRYKKLFDAGAVSKDACEKIYIDLIGDMYPSEFISAIQKTSRGISTSA